MGTKGNCASQNEEALAAALAKYGPLSICINSGDGQSGDWEKYKGGVLKGSCKAKASLMDHCVQLVGYDKTASQPTGRSATRGLRVMAKRASSVSPMAMKMNVAWAV